MANRRRGIFIGLLLGVVATASIAVAVAAYIQRLPDPNSTDRRGLFRWLIERDLREQPQDVQLAIMRRVEEELLAGIDFREVAAMLNDAQRQRLLENADLLARHWFRREANRYFAAPEDRRSLVLGEQIEQVQRLGIMDQLSALEHWSADHASAGQRSAARDRVLLSPVESAAGKAADGASGKPMADSVAAMAAQAKRIQQWLAQAEPQDRSEMAEYFTALRNRLLLDSFRRLDGVRKWLPAW